MTQLALSFEPRSPPYQRWHADGYAGTWLDFLDFINWIPGEAPEWPESAASISQPNVGLP